MIHYTLNHRLERAAVIWKLQCVIRSLAVVASIVTLAALCIGGLVVLDWATSPTPVYVALALTIVAGVIAGMVMVVRALDRRLDRQWLAESVESHLPPLLDRLNAVIELDRRPQDPSALMYRQAIERQATLVVKKSPDRSPFSWRTTNVHLAIAVALTLLTLWFYLEFEPLRRFASSGLASENVDLGNAPLTIPEIESTITPAFNDLDAKEPWGEIRISEPGRDLRVTRHEDVPLLIEAASDRPLSDVYWSTAINLQNETRHELPSSDDPRYAVFQPVLQPDTLGLKEWDLIHYQAVAVANDKTRYESATYFIEIIPSRKQLDELPEAAYQQLEKLTELIEQQQEVLRQTQRITDANDLQQVRRLETLTQQESHIADSAQHFQVAMENRLGPKATASLRTTLAASRESLVQAESKLREREHDDAIDPEQTALMRLAEARRQLADLIETHRDFFEPAAIDAVDETKDLAATTVDPGLAELLEKLAQERDETIDAAEQLEQMASEQQLLADQVKAQPTADGWSPLAESQQELKQRLESLRSAQPAPFRDLATLTDQTISALGHAAQQLARESSNATTATEHAVDRLQELAREMNRRRLAYDLAQSDTLQDRLKANQQQYTEIANEPQDFEPSQLEETTEETERLLSELQDVADRGLFSNSPVDPNVEAAAPVDSLSAPTGESELKQRLTPELANQIRAQCESLDRSNPDSDRSRLAGAIRKSLGELSDALTNDMASQSTKLDQQQLTSQLEQMQKRSEGLQSARQFVQQTLSRQRSIQRDAYMDRNAKKNAQSLAAQQAALETELGQEIERNPAGFNQSLSQCDSARSGMQQAAQSLRAGDPEASQLAENAAQQLQQLDDALEQQQQHNRISDSQVARDMIERMSQRLTDFAKAPESVTREQKQQTSGQCKSIGSQACQLAGQNPGNNSGSAARGGNAAEQGVASGNQERLEAASDRLADAEGSTETASAAQDLQQLLQEIASGLGAQQAPGQQRGRGSNRPSSNGQQAAEQMGQQPSGSEGYAKDTLRPTGGDAIDRGLAQLETAARRNEQGTLTKQAGQALRSGGIADLVAGIHSQYGYNERSQSVLVQLAEPIEDPSLPVDVKVLQQLREQIQSLQHDLTSRSDEPGSTQPTLYVDPSNFPPEYREAIQKYYQRLSEQP